MKIDNSTSIVSLDGICKNFGNFTALDRVSFNIETGIFGLIGPNGAGKTTLLRILLGLSNPTRGSGSVLGFDCQKDSLEIRKRVGVLHEKPSYPKTMTPEKYLTRVAGFYSSSVNVAETLEWVDLFDARSREVGKLSAGMLQRLGIAQALIGQPKLVFLDEPTSNLDVFGRKEIIRLMVRLHREQGISFIISSHVLSELEKACQSVVFLKEGHVVEKGKTLDIIQKHTIDCLKVMTPEPEALQEALQSLAQTIRVSFSGVNALTIKTEAGESSRIERDIYDLAAKRKIKIYNIEKASTLEDAYESIVSNDHI